MHTQSLTPRQHLAWHLIKPAVRVRIKRNVSDRWQTLTDSREAVMLPLGVAFWAVFAILSGLSFVGR